MNQPEDSFDIVEPMASPILESLRAFGYSAETAVADLIDNSISANASEIHVDFHWAEDKSWVSIVDNGHGMSEEALVLAMRLGSKSPLEVRQLGDLGRFGLGLKTASFSQARHLTVLSRTNSKDAEESVRCWDLDLVQTTNEWRLLRSAPEYLREPIAQLMQGPGTVVVLSELDRMLDRLQGQGLTSSRQQLFQVADRVATHLELVFHRYLSRKKPLRIFVNGKALSQWDPFLQTHPSTWSPGAEELPLAGAMIRVQPFVLPHKSKLTDEQHSKAAGMPGWNGSQGFYVYRNDRLLVGGTWLGVGGAQEEHSKLARISLDIPADLDHLWQVDVRKSSIKAPTSIQLDLRRIARMTKSKAQEVYRFRGKQLSSAMSNELVVAWNAKQLRGGVTQYRLNRKHPIVSEALTTGLSGHREVERFIRFVEETIPVTQIGISVAESLDQQVSPFAASNSEIRDQIEYMYSRLTEKGRDSQAALALLATIEPFTYYPDVVQAFREEHE